MAALRKRHTFVAHSSRYASADSCTGSRAGKLSCFFQRYDSCPSFEGEGAEDWEDADDGDERGTRVEQDNFLFMKEYGYAKRAQVMPKEFVGPHVGWFWFISQLLAFLTRPSARLKHKVEGVATALGVDLAKHRPLLTLHVRLGDSCLDSQAAQKGRDCEPLSAYMPHVEHMVKTHGYKAIFLATDSAEVVQEAQTKYSQYTWLFQKLNRTRFASFKGHPGMTIESVLWGPERKKFGLEKVFSAAREFDEFMIDSFLGARSDGLVGNFASNMDRLVYALMMAYGSPGGTCLKPFASLGGLYCFDYNVQSGLTKEGRHFWC